MKKAKEHLDETGWTYWQHLHHSIVTGNRLISVALKGYVHGLIPGIWPGKGPIGIYRIYKDMKKLRHVQRLYKAEDDASK